MQLIHQRLLRNGRLADVQRPQEVAGLQFAHPPTTYPRFGVNAHLAQATYNSMHAMAKRTCREDESVPTAFMRIVQELNQKRRVRTRSVDLIHFLGLAAHYGVEFESVEELREAVSGLHQLVAPSIRDRSKAQQRRDYWLHCGNLLALLGPHMRAPEVCEVIPGGLACGMIMSAAFLLATVERRLAGNKLLMLGVHSHLQGVNALGLARLINQHPDRVDDLIELMRRELLDQRAVDAFVAKPALFAALCMQAIDELISLADAGDNLLELARTLCTDLKDTNTLVALEIAIDEEPELVAEVSKEPEPKPDLPPVFDHTKLDIAEPVGSRTGLVVEAMQILLVHGVIQPDQSASTMINGSQVSRDEIEKLCRPHMERARIDWSYFEQGLTFLTTIRVLSTTTSGGRKRGARHQRSRRMQFNRIVGGNPRGKEIANRVLALNTEVRG